MACTLKCYRGGLITRAGFLILYNYISNQYWFKKLQCQRILVVAVNGVWGENGFCLICIRGDFIDEIIYVFDSNGFWIAF